MKQVDCRAGYVDFSVFRRFGVTHGFKTLYCVYRWIRKSVSVCVHIVVYNCVNVQL